MRSGHLGRLAAATGALLLTGACAQATGVAGISTIPPTPRAGGSPSVTATIPGPEGTRSGSLRPPAGEPVKVPPPKVSGHAYAFPVKGCDTTYQRKLLVLAKTTIWTGRGCSFVAPVAGVVDEINIKNRWKPSTDNGADREGRFVSIIGEDGVRYLGGHLDKVAEGIAPGTKVKAGQVLGQIGNSGNARDTATNLYFAISWKTGPAYWWVRRGMVEPWDYLDAWHTGNNTLSPKEEAFKLRRKVGETPPCTALCSSKKVLPPKEVEKKPKDPQPTPEPSSPLIETDTT